MRTLSGLMEPTGGGRGHDLFLIFGRVDNVNTPRRAPPPSLSWARLFTILTVKTKAVAGRPPFPLLAKRVRPEMDFRIISRRKSLLALLSLRQPLTEGLALAAGDKGAARIKLLRHNA